jgi:hypothetical protein
MVAYKGRDLFPWEREIVIWMEIAELKGVQKGDGF